MSLGTVVDRIRSSFTPDAAGFRPACMVLLFQAAALPMVPASMAAGYLEGSMEVSVLKVIAALGSALAFCILSAILARALGGGDLFGLLELPPMSWIARRAPYQRSPCEDAQACHHKDAANGNPEDGAPPRLRGRHKTDHQHNACDKQAKTEGDPTYSDRDRRQFHAFSITLPFDDQLAFLFARHKDPAPVIPAERRG